MVAGRGLPCRHRCERFVAHPANEHDRAALLDAIAERDAHELRCAGAPFDVAKSITLSGPRRASRIGNAL